MFEDRLLQQLGIYSLEEEKDEEGNDQYNFKLVYALDLKQRQVEALFDELHKEFSELPCGTQIDKFF